MRVAVLLPNWIGDTCMATPALRAIADSPRVSELVLVGKPGPLEVLRGLPYATNQIAYKPRSKSKDIPSRRGLAKILRRRSLDAVLLFPNSLSSALIAWLAGVPNRIGFNKNGRGLFLSHSISLLEQPQRDPLHVMGSYEATHWGDAPVIDFYLHIASQLGVETSDRRMELFASTEDRLAAKGLLNRLGLDKNQPLVVLNNASAASPSRLWPAEHTVELARLFAQSGMQVLFHAGPGDRESSLAFSRAASHPLIKSMGEEESLPISLSRGLLANADLVVSTDSGIRHMAIALDRRVVSLFGPTQADWTRTYNRPEFLEHVTMSCRPCKKDVCPLGHQSCMRNITVESVFAASQRALRTKKTNAA